MTHPTSIEINGHEHRLYMPNLVDPADIIGKSKDFYQTMDGRRSVRSFSDRSVPKEVIDHLIMTASTAPSGAHKQPWTFCAVANPALKSKIKEAAEVEERESYERRMSDQWLNDLKPMGTDMYKPFLEIAPWLIIVFKQVFELGEEGQKQTNYYVNESVGIACGMLITAIHQAGLVTLTHTPSPMNFLGTILERPKNERAFLLLPVGYPADPVYVPAIERKGLEEVATFYL